MKLPSSFRAPPHSNWAALLVILLCVSPACGVAFAQDPDVALPRIQVRTDEILVPVIVLDNKRLDAIHQMDVRQFLSEVKAPNSQLLLDLAVTGLPAQIFHIFEDGKEQPVERVNPAPGWNTNVPFGPDYRREGLSLADPDSRTRANFVLLALPHWPAYQVSYAPPPSPPGSCHSISVKIDRRNSYLLSRSEYCNTTHAAYDTLNGTPIGNQMLEDLGVDRSGSIRLTAAAVTLFDGQGKVHTHFLLNTPKETRKLDHCYDLPKVAVLGMIYSSDASLAARFSGRPYSGDLFSSNGRYPVPVPLPSGTGCYFGGSNPYRTRLELPPGEYKLQAVIRDGDNFGRATMPVHVRVLDASHLAVSDIAIGTDVVKAAQGAEPEPGSPDHRLPFTSKGYVVIPTANTRFKAGETLEFYFEIFVPPRPEPTAAKIQFRMRVVDVESNQVVKEVLPVDAASYQVAGDPVIPVGGGVDITKLAPGSYRLEAQAFDSAGESTEWSVVAFSVQ